MVDFKKKYIKTIRLNSFRPLCSTEIGRRAVTDYGHPPFIDGSCRREPDLQNQFPSITSLCRQEIFAPKLFPNDIIIYMTVKGKWNEDFDHHRLVAILLVTEKKESHLDASYWYKQRNLPIPSNCLVEDIPPISFEETAGNYKKTNDIKKYMEYKPFKLKLIGSRKVEKWDKEYKDKLIHCSVFVITKPIFVELWNPPILTDEMLINIFEKVPSTQNPKIITKDQFKKLAILANINLIEK